MKSNRFWLFLLSGIFIGSAVIAMLLWHVPTSYARIYKNNVLITDAVNLLNVNESYTITINDAAETAGVEGINIVEVDHGRIRMLEADCPDGLCVRQGWVKSGLIPVVCLPNRVIITFESDLNDTGADAVVG